VALVVGNFIPAPPTFSAVGMPFTLIKEDANAVEGEVDNAEEGELATGTVLGEIEAGTRGVEGTSLATFVMAAVKPANVDIGTENGRTNLSSA